MLLTLLVSSMSLRLCLLLMSLYLIVLTFSKKSTVYLLSFYFTQFFGKLSILLDKSHTLEVSYIFSKIYRSKYFSFTVGAFSDFFEHLKKCFLQSLLIELKMFSCIAIGSTFLKKLVVALFNSSINKIADNQH